MAKNILCWKRAVNAFVLDKDEEMKIQSSSTVGTENIDAVRVP